MPSAGFRCEAFRRHVVLLAGPKRGFCAASVAVVQGSRAATSDPGVTESAGSGAAITVLYCAG